MRKYEPNTHAKKIMSKFFSMLNVCNFSHYFTLNSSSINHGFDELSIGGWSFGTQKFKDMSATRYTRQTFIYSAVPFLRSRNFDGLDVDWEYPKGSDDKKNFVLLLKGKYIR